MKKETLNCMITAQEHARLTKLKVTFETDTFAETLEQALAYVAEIKTFEIKAPLRSSDNSWKKIHVLFSSEVYALIDRYARSNFRDLTNTIRFLINASYENITNSKK